MPKEDPYYTYTDYWPCRPARKVSPIELILALAAVLVLVGAGYYLSALFSLQGG